MAKKVQLRAALSGAFGVLSCFAAGHTYAASACGGTNTIQVSTQIPDEVPNNAAITANQTALDPTCQSNSVNSTVSLFQLGTLQNVNSIGHGESLWGIGSGDSFTISSASRVKGQTTGVAFGLDYNLGNQDRINYGFGLTNLASEQKSDETATLAGNKANVNATGIVGYMSYVKPLPGIGNTLIVNISSSIMTVNSHTSTSYKVTHFSNKSDGTSLAANVSGLLQHRFTATNSALVGMLGYGTVNNRFKDDNTKGRADQFLYGSLTYAQEVGRSVRLFVSAQAQKTDSNFKYGNHTQVTSGPIFVANQAGTVAYLVGGANWKVNDKWNLSLAANSASAKNYKETGVRVAFNREFGR